MRMQQKIDRDEPAAESEQRTVRSSAPSKFPSRRRRRVSLPLVRFGEPEKVALDNATMFDIIPFPRFKLHRSVR